MVKIDERKTLLDAFAEANTAELQVHSLKLALVRAGNLRNRVKHHGTFTEADMLEFGSLVTVCQGLAEDAYASICLAEAKLRGVIDAPTEDAPKG